MKIYGVWLASTCEVTWFMSKDSARIFLWDSYMEDQYGEDSENDWTALMTTDIISEFGTIETVTLHRDMDEFWETMGSPR